MVIGLDTMSSVLDYTDRNTCVLFGDGGGYIPGNNLEKGGKIKKKILTYIANI